MQTDEHGPVAIPKEVLDRYGERFRLVELDSGIKLVPSPDDPLEEPASLADLKEAPRDEARGKTNEL